MGQGPGTRRIVRAVTVVGFVGIVGGAGAAAAEHRADQPAGGLDGAFGTGGIVLTPAQFISAPAAPGLVIQEDGRIVVGGSTMTADGIGLALVRYRRDGALDPTFGAGGTVTTEFEHLPNLAGLALQHDGKIVAAVTVPAPDGSSTIGLTRYRRDGQLDEEFGTNGSVSTDFGAGTLARAGGVAVQNDGRIVVVGLVAAEITSPADLSMLARYEPSGVLDATFGVGGRVTVNFGTTIGQILNAVTIAHDGKIVVAGAIKAPTGGFTGTVARFDHDGNLDATFGIGGVVLRRFGSSSSFTAVAISHDGRIVATGSAPLTGVVAVFETDGTSDLTFGVDGVVMLPIPPSEVASITAMTIDRCDRIVAAGSIGPPSEMAVFRFDRDGSPDPAFGAGGLVTTTIGDRSLEADAVAITPDGDIVVTGATFSSTLPYSESFMVARYDGGDDRGCGCGRDERRY